MQRLKYIKKGKYTLHRLQQRDRSGLMLLIMENCQITCCNLLLQPGHTSLSEMFVQARLHVFMPSCRQWFHNIAFCAIKTSIMLCH